MVYGMRCALEVIFQYGMPFVTDGIMEITYQIRLKMKLFRGMMTLCLKSSIFVFTGKI